MINKNCLLVLILFLGYLSDIYAQVPNPYGSGRTYGTFDSSAINTSNDTFAKKDLEVFQLSLLDFNYKEPFYDSLNNNPQRLEPIYLLSMLPGNLGSINSAAYQSQLQHNKYLGLRIGHEQYDILMDGLHSSDFMEVNRSLWAIHYQKGYNINSSNVSIDFYRRFNNNLLLNFNYDRFSDRSWLGNQSNKLGNLDLKFYQYTPEGKRKSYVLYSNKSIEENHSRTLISGENGLSTYAMRWIEFGNEFLLKKGDTGRSHQLDTKISIKSNKYQFDDSSLSSTEIDAYGVVDSLSKVNYSNDLSSLYLSNTYSIQSSTDHLSISANISSNSINNTVDTISQFQISTELDYSRKLSDSLSLDLSSSYFNWKGKSEFSLNANIEGLGRRILWNVGVSLATQQATLFQSKAYIGDLLLWDHDFDPFSYYEGIVDLLFLPLDLKVQSQISYYKNAIVSDITGRPIQLSESFVNSSIMISRDFDWWILRSSHHLMWQDIGSEYIVRPSFQLNGNIASDFNIFKAKLQSTLGLDYYYFYNFTTPSFNPIFGTFYNDGRGVKSGHILVVNPYAAFKVDDFSFYFKMENALSRLVGQNYFLTRDYNIYDFRISFGIKWRLLD